MVYTGYVYTVADYSLIENSSLRLIATNGLGLEISRGVKLPGKRIDCENADSKALLRELDTAKRHGGEGRTEAKDDREPCKYERRRIEDRDRRRDISESRDREREVSKS